MNRLHSPKALKFKHPSSASPLTTHSLVSDLPFPELAPRVADRGEPPHYSLFAPLHYERGYAYPLVVWLHDEGGNERELRQVMPHVSVRNYVAAAARGVASAGSRHGYSWGESSASANEAVDRVDQCIEAAKARFNVNPRRVFIAGNGAGGTMALRLALQFPRWFAGAVSLGGPMPLGNCPLKCVNDARRLPLLLATCRQSADYPPARVVEDLRLLHAAGFSLALRQYPGDSALTTGMLADMDRWMMEQVCVSSPTATNA
jgi:phospholipase/carboxylesterase